MTTTTLISMSISPMFRSLRRWWMRRQIAAIDRDLDLIRAERVNGHMAERELVRERAVMCSQLRGM